MYTIHTPNYYRYTTPTAALEGTLEEITAMILDLHPSDTAPRFPVLTTAWEEWAAGLLPGDLRVCRRSYQMVLREGATAPDCRCVLHCTCGFAAAYDAAHEKVWSLEPQQADGYLDPSWGKREPTTTQVLSLDEARRHAAAARDAGKATAGWMLPEHAALIGLRAVCDRYGSQALADWLAEQPATTDVLYLHAHSYAQEIAYAATLVPQVVLAQR